MERELFEKVYVRSEGDLPKESGFYSIHEKGYSYNYPSGTVLYNTDNIISKERWINNVAWYLRPVPQPERKTAEEIINEIKTLFYVAYNEGFNHTKSPQFDKWVKEKINDLKISFNSLQSREMPSEEESNEELEKKSFRVPYDGSNNFYDKSFIKGWESCYEWLKSKLG